MLRLTCLVLSLGLVLAITTRSYAEDKTLKGTVTCAKCDLGIEKTCATVIKVKEGDKDVIYYFDKDSSKKYHSKICQTPTEGTVTGTVSKEGDKNIVKVTKVDYK